jgi:hypothetical protein
MTNRKSVFDNPQQFATPTGLCYNLSAWDSQDFQRIDRQHLPDS